MATTLKKRFDAFVKDVGFSIIQFIERLMVRYSPHGDPYFFDNEDFPWTDELDDNWAAIREEMDVVLEHREALPNFQDISEDQKAITTDDDWKTFFLYGFGHKAEKNCKLVPKTTEIAEQVPGMKTAFFSILSPGKHIPAHRGPIRA